jgi:large subunit ribosomal protein L5
MARLKEEYNKTIKKEIMQEKGYRNPMQVPTLEKIVINVGAGEAAENRAALDEIIEMVSVTLRGEKMWEFFDKLVNIALPRTKDFRGLSPNSFDGAGNYSIGIEDHTVFIEIDPNSVTKIRSLQVTIVTTAKTDEEGKMLLDKFGFPFIRDVHSS